MNRRKMLRVPRALWTCSEGLAILTAFLDPSHSPGFSTEPG